MLRDEKLKKVVEELQSLAKDDKELADDCIRYIFSQLNDDTLLGSISYAEYMALARKAIFGVLQIIYLKHYSKDLVLKNAFSIACVNLIILLFSRVLEGKDRALVLAEIESRRAVLIGAPSGAVSK